MASSLTVLGATGGTGGTGREVVAQALTAGHSVTALVRRPEALTRTDERLRVVVGDLADNDAVAEACAGGDAVLSALGSRGGRVPTTVYSTGIAAVLRAGAPRVVAVSAIPAGLVSEKTWLERRIVHPLLWRFFGGGYADMRRMEAELAVSAVAWTVLRPPRLTDGPATGAYRLDTGRLPRARTLSRADLAAAMLAALDDESLVGRIVQVAS